LIGIYNFASIAYLLNNLFYRKVYFTRKFILSESSIFST
jgi:hypothetical protein